MKAPWLLCLTGLPAVILPGRVQVDPLYRGERLRQYVQALRDPDEDLRVKAATAGGEMRLPNPSVLTALAAALRDQSPELCQKDDNDVTLREAAAAAIRQIRRDR